MDRREKPGCDDRIRFSLSQEMIAILVVGVTLAGIMLANMAAMRAESEAWRAEVRAEAQARDEAVRAEAQSGRSVVDTGLSHPSSNTER